MICSFKKMELYYTLNYSYHDTSAFIQDQTTGACHRLAIFCCLNHYGTLVSWSKRFPNVIERRNLTPVACAWGSESSLKQPRIFSIILLKGGLRWGGWEGVGMGRGATNKPARPKSRCAYTHPWLEARYRVPEAAYVSGFSSYVRGQNICLSLGGEVCSSLLFLYCPLPRCRKM